MVKSLPANAGDARVPGSGMSPGGGHGNPLQYSCLGNPWAEGPGGLKSRGSQRGTEHTHLEGFSEAWQITFMEDGKETSFDPRNGRKG